MKIRAKPKKKKKPGYLCQHPDCRAKKQNSHECITCERLGKSFHVHSCRQHLDWGIQKIKRHALTAHPVNILRAGVAALKGEDVF